MVGNVKIGERLQIPNDGFGNPVREFDRKTRKPIDKLQWFEVTEITHGSVKLKPIWP